MDKQKKYVGLSDAERSEISILLKRECSLREIARALGRSPNTISYEVRMNSVLGMYDPRKAKHKSRVARRSRRFQWQKIEQCPKLRTFIIRKLKADWSPDEIAGYLKAHPARGYYVSSRQLYAWLYSSRGQPYCQYLYAKRYHPKQHAKKTERVMIPDRNPLLERPQTALDRLELATMSTTVW